MLGPSAPVASNLQSACSHDTWASPGTTSLTTKQTEHKKSEVRKYVSEYTPWLQTELNGSARGGWNRTHRRRPRSAWNTAVIDWRGRPGARDTSNDQPEINGNKVLETEDWACADWNLPNAVWPLRGWQMLVVQEQNAWYAEACLPPLYLVERPAECALEGGRKGLWMESGQMRAFANIRAFHHGMIGSSGNGHSGSYWLWEVPAKTCRVAWIGGEAEGGAWAGGTEAGLKVFGPGVVSLSLRWSLWSMVLSNRVHMIGFPLSHRTMGSWWELCHLAVSPGVRGGAPKICHTRITVDTVRIK